jgi:hypothetical protein
MRVFMKIACSQELRVQEDRGKPRVAISKHPSLPAICAASATVQIQWHKTRSKSMRPLIAQ